MVNHSFGGFTLLPSSRLNLLKPCQNRFRLRPDGNKPRMPNDTDLAPVSAHRRKVEPFHARCPETGFGHFRQQRDGMAGAHQLGNLGETGATESKIWESASPFRSTLESAC